MKVIDISIQVTCLEEVADTVEAEMNRWFCENEIALVQRLKNCLRTSRPAGGIERVGVTGADRDGLAEPAVGQNNHSHGSGWMSEINIKSFDKYHTTLHERFDAVERALAANDQAQFRA